MNKIARTISATLAAAATAATIGITTAGPAAANPGPAEQQRMARIIRLENPSSSRFYSDAQLIRAAQVACQRKQAYGLGAQIGRTRTRIIQAVERDVNNWVLGGQRLGLAKGIVRKTGINYDFPYGYCR